VVLAQLIAMQRMELLCALPGCELLAHSNVAIIDHLNRPFCCLKCQGRHDGEDWASRGKKHYKHCEQRLPAEPGTGRASHDKLLKVLLVDKVLTAASGVVELKSPPQDGDIISIPDSEEDPTTTSLEESEPWIDRREGCRFCLPCKKFITAEHLASESHARRLQWFLDELEPPDLLKKLSRLPPPPPPPPPPQPNPNDGDTEMSKPRPAMKKMPRRPAAGTVISTGPPGGLA